MPGESERGYGERMAACFFNAGLSSAERAGYALSDWTAEVAAIWATWEDSSLGLPHHVGQLGAARGTSPRDMFTQGVRHPLDKHDLSKGYYNEKEWIDKANAGEIRPQKRSLQPGNPGVK